MRRPSLSAVLLAFSLLSVPAVAQNLEIHVINVGWGQSTFIKGPGASGKTILLEAGNTGKGTNEVVPYLQSIGHAPSAGFDYALVGHQHCDHAGGMDEVINAGYDVRFGNYYNGSSYSSSCITGWNTAASSTTAGVPVEMRPGDVIDLGGGAILTCIASRGRIIGGATTSASNENDLSIALLLQYGGFDYYWASDLGGGSDDSSCTGRSTSQINVETPVMQAISPGGAHPLISSGGIDVLHVSHHGSESSTNNDLYDLAVPALSVISTGAGQTTGWDLPRIDVVENVLLAQASCVDAAPSVVLQTEEGSPIGSLTSTSGHCVGDIVITTDGLNLFTVSANGNVNQGPSELSQASLPRSFTIDDSGSGGGGDATAPAASVTAPASGATISGTVVVAASASDNVGVARVDFFLDSNLVASDSSAPYEWSWNTTASSDGGHQLQARAYDAAGNSGTSAPVDVTVANAVPAGRDLSGYEIVQAESALSFVLPAGTSIPAGGYVIVARNATRAQFETFWNTTLGSDVVFINSGDRMPQINGLEKYTLLNNSGRRIDGATVAMSSAAGRSYQRKSGCSAAGKTTSWNVVASTSGTPGAGAPAPCGKGVFISEFSDATGTGNYIYEFVELHDDAN